MPVTGWCLVVGESPRHKASLLQTMAGGKAGDMQRDPVAVAGVWGAEGQAWERVFHKREGPPHTGPGRNYRGGGGSWKQRDSESRSWLGLGGRRGRSQSDPLYRAPHWLLGAQWPGRVSRRLIGEKLESLSGSCG